MLACATCKVVCMALSQSEAVVGSRSNIQQFFKVGILTVIQTTQSRIGKIDISVIFPKANGADFECGTLSNSEAAAA